MSVEPTRRRRFKWAFSLRTLFVVVLVAAIPMAWLVWQVQIVRERKALLQSYESREDVDIAYDLGTDLFTIDGSDSNRVISTTLIPAWKLWLGDEAVASFRFTVKRPLDSETERIKALFPEAHVFWMGDVPSDPTF